MNISYRRFALDLDKQDSQVYVNVRKGDTAVRLSCTLRGSGIPYEITDGVTAVLAASLPDGTYKEAVCAIEGNRIEIMLDSQHTASAGRIPAHFELTEGTAALSSPRFTIAVDDPDS